MEDTYGQAHTILECINRNIGYKTHQGKLPLYSVQSVLDEVLYPVLDTKFSLEKGKLKGDMIAMLEER